MLTIECKDRSASSLCRQPWLIEVHGEKKQTCKFISPVKGSMEDRNIPEMQGKNCLGCYGEWALLIDKLTRECFFLSLVSYSTVHLPSFPESIEPVGTFSLTSSPTSADNITTFVPLRDNIILLCRLHDKEWTKWPITCSSQEFTSYNDIHTTYKGQLFLFNHVSKVFVYDLASLIEGRIEMTFSYPFHDYPMPSIVEKYFVKSCNGLFLVSIHLFGDGQNIIHIEVYQLCETPDEEEDDHNNLYWDYVSSIGDQAFFLSRKYGLSLCAKEVGVEPNCIYSTLSCLDGERLYKFCLEDQTYSFNVLLPENIKRFDNELFWTVPLPRMQDIEFVTCSYVMESKKVMPVCKSYASALETIPETNAWPWLMHSPNINNGIVKFFDPVNCKEYKRQIDAILANEQLTFHSSIDGWVVISEGSDAIFILNPITEEVVNLPPLDVFDYHFISFIGVPTSSDFRAFAFDFIYGEEVAIHLWHPGQEVWIKTTHENDTKFRGTINNPVLFNQELYCLDERGQLGVFNPDKMTWRILSKPEPLYSELSLNGHACCALLKLNDDLIAVFRTDNMDPIRVFKLDPSQMAWSKIEDLEDVTLYLGLRNSLVASSPVRSHRNGIFLPKFASREHRMGVFYSMDDQMYHPKFYEVEEPINYVWFKPNAIITNKA